LNTWHLITGEYPPQPGGVSDYSRLVAQGLAESGDAVHVYAPPAKGEDLPEQGIVTNRLPGHFDPRSLRILGPALRDHPDDLVLVQYVPHAFGYKAMNLPFCLWLNHLRRKHRRIVVMFHEVAMPLRRRQPLSHRLLAIVTAPMAMLVARAASTIFVSIPAWKDRLMRLGVRQPMEWLPVPSTIAVVDDQAAVEAHRREIGAKLIIGHFGTCAGLIGESLKAALPRLLEVLPGAAVMLIGRDGVALRQAIGVRQPHLAGRIHAAGGQSSHNVSLALAACDLMIQPYEDGVSSRRTAVMAALVHKRPVVATRGESTEPIWADAGAIALVPAGNHEALYRMTYKLSADERERQRLAVMGARLYDQRFAPRHTLEALRRTACA
jgi:glycosyltransferase involved in cell wall biosynthesis